MAFKRAHATRVSRSHSRTVLSPAVVVSARFPSGLNAQAVAHVVKASRMAFSATCSRAASAAATDGFAGARQASRSFAYSCSLGAVRLWHAPQRARILLKPICIGSGAIWPPLAVRRARNPPSRKPNETGGLSDSCAEPKKAATLAGGGLDRESLLLDRDFRFDIPVGNSLHRSASVVTTFFRLHVVSIPSEIRKSYFSIW